MSTNSKCDQTGSASKLCILFNKPGLKRNRLWRWLGCISMTNFRPFLSSFLQKKPGNIWSFSLSKTWSQTMCWKFFISSTIYHLTNDYLLQWAICWFSGLPVLVFFSGLTPEKLVRSPMLSKPNKSVPVEMSSRVVCFQCWEKCSWSWLYCDAVWSAMPCKWTHPDQYTSACQLAGHSCHLSSRWWPETKGQVDKNPDEWRERQSIGQSVSQSPG